MIDVTIRSIKPGEPLPMDLLLLADPSEELVREYTARAQIFVAEVEGDIVGVGLLIQTRPATQELVNLAVDPRMQGKGLGKLLIQAAIEKARSSGAHTLELGTGNSSIGQLALYQKMGFRIDGVDQDFFVRHYTEPIIENGIPCRDMIRLAMDLLHT